MQVQRWKGLCRDVRAGGFCRVRGRGRAVVLGGIVGVGGVGREEEHQPRMRQMDMSLRLSVCLATTDPVRGHALWSGRVGKERERASGRSGHRARPDGARGSAWA